MVLPHQQVDLLVAQPAALGSRALIRRTAAVSMATVVPLLPTAMHKVPGVQTVAEASWCNSWRMNGLSGRYLLCR